MSHSAYRPTAAALGLFACLASACSTPAEHGELDPDAADSDDRRDGGTPDDVRDGRTPDGTGDSGLDTDPGPCASRIKPAIEGCNGVLLTDPSAILEQSAGIASTSGPVGSPAVRIADEQSLTIKDSDCHQLGKDGSDFSLSMWLKASSGSSQIIGTTSQYDGKQGFILNTKALANGDLELQLSSFADGSRATVKSAPLAPDTWTHVVVRYDANDAAATASLDVNLQHTAGLAEPNVYNDHLRVGDHGYGSIAAFDVSELRSYQRLLTYALA